MDQITSGLRKLLLAGIGAAAIAKEKGGEVLELLSKRGEVTVEQGKVLNEMMEIFTQIGKNIDVEKALKEFVGHTPLQVLMGAILGIIIAIGMCNMQFFA